MGYVGMEGRKEEEEGRGEERRGKGRRKWMDGMRWNEMVWIENVVEKDVRGLFFLYFTLPNRASRHTQIM